ncbi:zinc-binding alcohol dehydrogenase family protein [Listeria sp. FSL L7-1582]|uniref:zinc-binding alcohol dehydrogenase family protein n=1 Tax=Listeria portnoyi TaxID=2713504 RepID=UPI00164D0009|nr:zinc-binding alcohol dehydrogenase family protein [Listeria portnoyi]MBC6308477.1 zinc-binding alcohol dehydrogenase family protein [Listeria portnoyi]
MKTVVAINPRHEQAQKIPSLGGLSFGDTIIEFGVIQVSEPTFNIEDEANNDFVLLKVKSFSCNYRDKALLLENYISLQKYNRAFLPFGSEFCAEVIKVGKYVHEFNFGDVVMADNSYPHSGESGVKPGVATNFSSLGWLRLHKKKIIKKPASLTNSEAAAFSLGAQTATGMINKSEILKNGGTPLVLSSRSNTSLFIIQQLLSHDIIPICLTTSNWTQEDKQRIYPCKILNLTEVLEGVEMVKEDITHVFDPFCDMNMEYGLYLLGYSGVYITCGLRDQHPKMTSESSDDILSSIRGSLSMIIMKNIIMKGNCLGSHQDLVDAIRIQNTSDKGLILDKVYSLNQSIEFIKSSFFDATRFGKSVIETD